MLRSLYVRSLVFGLGLFGYSFLPSARADRAPPPPPSVAAPAPSRPSAAAADAEGFVPDSRPPNMNTVDESIPAAPLVATAYGFIWFAVLGFVLYTLRRTQHVEKEIAELSALIRRAVPPST